MPPVGIDMPKNTNQPMRRDRRRWIAVWTMLGIMLLLLLTTIGLGVFLLTQPRLTNIGSVGADGNLIASAEESDVTKIVNAVSPSVVSIMAFKGNNSSSQGSAGTGVIISKDGYILTNKHVIDHRGSGQAAY